MPAKNILKDYVENGYYHIYNRGVEGRNIFMDERDYKVFLHLLKRYLTPTVPNPEEIRPRFNIHIHDKIQLIAYCLMPNHFHLMIKQFTKEAITLLMRSLGNSYVYYFNKRYERRGPLYQGRYKAVLIENEPYFLHLTRYIHLNPLDKLDKDGPRSRTDPATVEEHPYSSYGEYLGRRKTEWVHPEEILTFFKTAQKTSLKDILSYQSFVEDYLEDSKEILGPLVLEE